MILTCLATLMKLLDDTGVTSFETFRCITGNFNEWEVVLFLEALQRGESFQSSPCLFIIDTVSPVS